VAATTGGGVIEEQRAVVEHLGVLLRDDKIDLESFEVATSRVLATTTPDELAVVVAVLPSPVRMTPPHRRLEQPLKLETRSGKIEMVSPWQVGAETHVSCQSGVVVLDLTMAEFDDDLIDLDLECRSGKITVIVPPGVGLQVVEANAASGMVKNELGHAVIVPGMPSVRVSASTQSGLILLRRPKPPKPPRRRWFRRRDRDDD
jgi:hypothetical protein